MMHFHLFLLAKILSSLNIITEEEDNKGLARCCHRVRLIHDEYLKTI